MNEEKQWRIADRLTSIAIFMMGAVFGSVLTAFTN
jgi:uncharacterized membrane protein YoaK (UPF0700 family)